MVHTFLTHFYAHTPNRCASSIDRDRETRAHSSSATVDLIKRPILRTESFSFLRRVSPPNNDETHQLKIFFDAQAQTSDTTALA